MSPHAVCILDEGGSVVKTYEPSGTVPRVSTTADIVSSIDGIDVVETVFGEVEGLPEADQDTVYIVSALVRMAASDRADLVSPDTSPASAVRNDKGHIVGVKRFTR